MKSHLALLCSVLLVGLAAINLNAQGPADTHVNAAKAVSAKAGSTQSWQDFNYLFDRECRAPGAGRGGRGAEAEERRRQECPARAR